MALLAKNLPIVLKMLKQLFLLFLIERAIVFDIGVPKKTLVCEHQPHILEIVRKLDKRTFSRKGVDADDHITHVKFLIQAIGKFNGRIKV